MCKPFFLLSNQSNPDNSIVVKDIELDPFDNPAREGLRLTTYGPRTKEVAHPWSNQLCMVRCFYGPTEATKG